MRIEYHRTLIADRVRNHALQRALAAVIEPGVTTVADIGAGTGLLGLMAARLGARDVYLYEAAEVAAVASRILAKNKARNCHLIPCHSTEMQDPPQVDVVISETLGNYPFEEHIIETLIDARERFLKPGGMLIPCAIQQFVAPVVSDRIYQELAIWDDLELGLDLSPAKTMSLNNAYVRSLLPEELLDQGRSGQPWDHVDLLRVAAADRKGKASWSMSRSTTIYGFATWWLADLGHGISLSTAPSAPRTHWEQLYLPLLSPIVAERGETVEIALRSRTALDTGTTIRWTATRHSAAGDRLDRQVLDLEKGYLP